MQRLQSVDPAQAEGRAKELLDAVEAAFGATPNAARLMANSPPVLDSFLAFSAAMSGAKIGAKLHNQIKLATSEANACDYCTSLLCAIAPSAGLTAADIVAGRAAASPDPRVDAALQFARAVLDSQGRVSETQFAAIREAGYDDAEIVEIVASVVLGCFTNFLNNAVGTEIDIPRAPALTL